MKQKNIVVGSKAETCKKTIPDLIDDVNIISKC